jgi:hypothetical protein
VTPTAAHFEPPHNALWVDQCTAANVMFVVGKDYDGPADVTLVVQNRHRS